MLQNKTNFGDKSYINYENNNLEKKSNNKKWLRFYRNNNHNLLEINKALK